VLAPLGHPQGWGGIACVRGGDAEQVGQSQHGCLLRVRIQDESDVDMVCVTHHMNILL
jgi:hypothetical protein